MERLLCDLQGDDDSWSFWKFQPGFTIVVSNIIEGEDLFQRCNGKIYWIWFSKLYWRRVIIKQKLEEENKNKTFPPFSALKKKVFFHFFSSGGGRAKSEFWLGARWLEGWGLLLWHCGSGPGGCSLNTWYKYTWYTWYTWYKYTWTRWMLLLKYLIESYLAFCILHLFIFSGLHVWLYRGRDAREEPVHFSGNYGE